MATTLLNLLDQAIDIAGSYTKTDSLIVSDEALSLGSPIGGQSGATASITSGVTITVSGLTGMTTQSVGRFLVVSGGATPANNGTFLITTFNSATSVDISNPSGATDANNGAISWEERNPYTLESDLNYESSDRAAIKGVAYSAAIPTYTRLTATTTNVPANLANIAGKTTDARGFVVNRKFENSPVTSGNTFITITDVGNLKHATSIDRTGVPINDGFDIGNDGATYVEIIDGYSAGLYVLTGPNAGNRIFGRTRAGGSTSPNSVEIEFRSVPDGAPISSSIAYTWEVGQPTTVDLFYGYRERLDLMDENALRTTMVNGIVGDSGLRQNIVQLQQTVGVLDGDTSLSGKLTNTGVYYPFNNLPDVTPSVVEALNTLNEQIGSRDYAGSILTDGYTITQSLQQLADAIGASGGLTRTIERLGGAVTANSTHTLPGGLNYVLDGTSNGRNMWVFWRKLLRDPGTISAGDDYQEVSVTQIRPFTRINAGDHINYFIKNT